MGGWCAEGGRGGGAYLRDAEVVRGVLRTVGTSHAALHELPDWILPQLLKI